MAHGGEIVNEVALELDALERAGADFKSRFSSILTGFPWHPDDPEPLGIDDADADAVVRSYEEAETIKQKRAAEEEKERQKWWEAVQETVREDTELFEKVRRKEEGPCTPVPSVSVMDLFT